MSTLINLLPDLRQVKLRDRRRRQMVTGVSLAIWVVCGVVVGVMTIVMLGQKAVIATTTRGIEQKMQNLKNINGLVEALTASQHAAALPSLYDKRVFMTKFFAAYSEADPATVTVGSLAVDSQNILTVRGAAPTYADVAKLARAMAVSNVQVGTGADPSKAPYFSSVNITSVDNSDKVNFSISATMESGVTSGK